MPASRIIRHGSVPSSPSLNVVAIIATSAIDIKNDTAQNATFNFFIFFNTAH